MNYECNHWDLWDNSYAAKSSEESYVWISKIIEGIEVDRDQTCHPEELKPKQKLKIQLSTNFFKKTASKLKLFSKNTLLDYLVHLGEFTLVLNFKDRVKHIILKNSKSILRRFDCPGISSRNIASNFTPKDALYIHHIFTIFKIRYKSTDGVKQGDIMSPNPIDSLK